MKVIQQEQELGHEIYNGEKTVLYFLKDLRVGDTIEYSYTIKGRNPALKKLHASTYRLAWSVPVAEQHIRLLAKDTPVYHKLTGLGKHALKITNIAHDTEYTLHQHNLIASTYEDSTPNWYLAYPTLAFTTAQDWREIIDWGIQIYDDVEKKEIGITSLLQNKDLTGDELILSIIRFVQDEIRYLGIEVGAGSLIPHTRRDPSKALWRL